MNPYFRTALFILGVVIEICIYQFWALARDGPRGTISGLVDRLWVIYPPSQFLVSCVLIVLPLLLWLHWYTR